MQQLWSIGDSQHGSFNSIALLNMPSTTNSFNGDSIIGDGCIGPNCGMHMQNLRFSSPILNLTAISEMNKALKGTVNQAKADEVKDGISSSLGVVKENLSGNSLLLMNLGEIQKMNRGIHNMVTDARDSRIDAAATGAVQQVANQLGVSTDRGNGNGKDSKSLLVLVDAGDKWGNRLGKEVIGDMTNLLDAGDRAGR